MAWHWQKKIAFHFLATEASHTGYSLLRLAGHLPLCMMFTAGPRLILVLFFLTLERDTFSDVQLSQLWVSFFLFFMKLKQTLHKCMFSVWYHSIMRVYFCNKMTSCFINDNTSHLVLLPHLPPAANHFQIAKKTFNRYLGDYLCFTVLQVYIFLWLWRTCKIH